MELNYHKIEKIVNRRARYQYPRLCGKNSRLAEHAYGGEVNIVEIITDKGATGWGLGYCDENMKGRLIGRSLSTLFDPTIGIVDQDARCLDIALHDLAGKILGISVKNMINPISTLESVDCYDGAIYMNDISPDGHFGGIERVIEDCRYDYYEEGFRKFKIKVGRGGMWMDRKEGLQRDIDVVRAIHKEFPDSPLLVDANDAFTVDEAISFMDAVADCGIFWIEEPFAESVEGFTRLREFLEKKSPNTMIADGESNPCMPLLHELAKRKLIDVYLMDTEGHGFSNWRMTMDTVNALGIKASPHNWGCKLKTLYASHLAAAFNNITTIEGVLDKTEGISFDDYKMNDGFLTVPDKAGFGLEIFWTRII